VLILLVHVTRLDGVAVTVPARLAKRLLDLGASALGLLTLAPVLGVTALAVRLTMGRPALFRQRRPGLGGQTFEILKFRTMRDLRDASGRLLSDAERLTALGQLLRRTSLDELPELWNVVRGDMSLVGPRPLLVEYLPRYSPEQARRHEVKPGITGWAQVNGRNALTWEEKFELDVWYVDHQSLALDLRILLATVRTVLAQGGVSAQGHATMEPFRGSPPVSRG
jgi:lipopolysaccharide/colanic/teichoic acid biosynthesis glycosyltransferase